MLDHLRSTCRIIKERRQRHASIVNASRNARRKEEQRRQLVVAGAAIAGTETSLAPVNQPPPNLRPERESPASTQTGTDDPTSVDRAV